MTSAPAALATSRFSVSHRIRYVLISLALLLPCFWQPRIQAGDLSSHIYNAWLAQLIESGQAGGLMIARQSTNILFDLFLSGLFRLAGPEWAQRVAVSCTVLIFAWGAFAFISAAAGRRAWHLLPVIAMLAYGWVFHMGLFNFHLSLGLCFWALALVWNSQPRRAALAAPLLLLAYTAHALPVAWTAGLIVYLWIARRVSLRARSRLLATSLVLIAVVHAGLSRTLLTDWSLRQISLATGADQLWVFDGKYGFILAGLVLIWGSLFLELIRGPGRPAVVSGIPFQVSVLSAAAVFILPNAVALPGFHHSLTFIGERMSLAVGVCMCAMLAIARARAAQRYGFLVLAAVYFLFLFRDERALNRFEDRIDDAVAHLPPGQRVVSPIIDPGLRVNALAHMIDRACMGRCFSYANYEPSTAAFRVRAVEVNPLVIESYDDAWELQTGRHVVKDHELPLFRIGVSAEGQMDLQSLKAGVLCRSTLWEVLKNRTPSS